MAWYERSKDRHKEVRVLEVRDCRIWERVARKAGLKSTPGTGRVRLLEELPTAAKAEARAEALGTAMLADGWELVDAKTGVDASFPKSRVPKADFRLKGDDIVSALKDEIAALPVGASRVEQLVVVFREVLQRPLAVRRKGFSFEVYGDNTGLELSLRVKVASAHEYWRELGLQARVRVPKEQEIASEGFQVDVGNVDGFIDEVRACEAFQAIAHFSCFDIKSIDDEID